MKRRGRRFVVSGIDFGDGTRVTASIYISASGVSVKRYRSRTTFYMPLDEAVQVLARRAQVRECEVQLGARR
jgi:hypothetical protein